MLRSLVIVCALCHVAAAQSWTIGEGTVVTPSANVVYVMEAKALTAIDLAKGRTKWTNKALVKPMAQVGDALLALDDKGALRVVDARTGKPRKSCDTIPTVTMYLFDGIGYSQTSSAVSDGKVARIAWSVSTFFAGGIDPTPEQAARARSHREGVWEVDVAACSATSSQAPVQTPKGLTGVTPGGIAVTLVPGTAIERARGVDKLPEIKLTTNQIALSADNAHAITWIDTDPGYEITLVDLDAAKSLATFKTAVFPLPAMLVGGRFLVGAGWVYDIAKRKELWRRPLRSAPYRTPMP
jgi:WD40 repeat protein